ncbi:hypothetical protein [Ilumatobacter sp.]
MRLGSTVSKASVHQSSFTEAAQWIIENAIPRTEELVAQIPAEEPAD